MSISVVCHPVIQTSPLSKTMSGETDIKLPLSYCVALNISAILLTLISKTLISSLFCVSKVIETTKGSSNLLPMNSKNSSDKKFQSKDIVLTVSGM